ncbi:MAG: zinc ribbon domain-containing protein [Betaproteobacteria bacterium]|nr:zinc ribbon domain-containing protein [Betaproteobacteria bacterium]
MNDTMPTYEYECRDCLAAWEMTQKITEEPARSCPKCGHDAAKRLISARGGFALKGGGWAADKYASTRPR